MGYRLERACDQCDVPEGVPAVATISLPSGRILEMCSHHLNENAVALLKTGAIILDDREVLE